MSRGCDGHLIGVAATSEMRPIGNGSERVRDGNGVDGIDRKRSVDEGEEEGTEKEVKVDTPEETKTGFVRWTHLISLTA